MKRKLIFLLFFISFKLSATVQIRDLLIIDRDTFYIQSPIDNSNSEFQEKWYKTIPDLTCMNSACWRGAICVWVLENDSIYLSRIISCCDYKDISLSVIENEDKIFAKWISGTYDYSSGKRICENIFWMPLIDDSYYIYEYDNLITINNGKVIKHAIFDNKKARIGSFDSEESLFEDINKRINVYATKGQVVEFDMTFNADENGHMININLVGVQDTLIINDIRTALIDYEGLPVFYRFGKIVEHQFEGHFVMYKY